MAAAAAALLIAAACGDDSSSSTTSDPTSASSSASTTTTSAPSTSSKGSEVHQGRHPLAVWPRATATERFESYADAALGFARDLLGMTAASESGDAPRPSASGVGTEVPVRPYSSGGPTTWVTVVETTEGWQVIGSTSEHVVVDVPAAGAAATGEVAVSGTSTAFEASITLEVLDGGDAVLAETHTTGGANGEMGPFSATVVVPADAVDPVLIVAVPDMSDQGRNLTAAVVPLGRR